MLIAEVPAHELAEWARRAAAHGTPATLHVLPRGYELRAGELPPLRLEVVPHDPVRG